MKMGRSRHKVLRFSSKDGQVSRKHTQCWGVEESVSQSLSHDFLEHINAETCIDFYHGAQNLT